MSPAIITEEQRHETSTEDVGPDTTRRTGPRAYVVEDESKRPWSAVTVLFLAGLLLAAWIAGSTVWAVDQVEDDLARETLDDLASAGFDTDGLTVNFDYRDGEISGDVPAGLDTATAQAAVSADLLDDLTVRTPQPPAEVPFTSSTDPESPDSAAAETNPSDDASRDADGGAVTPRPGSLQLTASQEVIALQAQFDGLSGEIQETLVFGFASAELTNEARATLDRLAASMAQLTRPVVDVSGHTDDEGDPQLNVELSQRRAESVVTYLVEQGIDPDRLIARGAGPYEPIATNDTEAGRAENRRVQFIALPSFS